jgi:glutamate-1-semialdehyde 2,1-aminomutase
LRNADLVAAANRVIPGGSQTRSKKVFGRFAAWADGAIVTDVEGNSYIDTMSALGAISLGYRPAPSAGGVYSFPHQWEPVAAEAVLRHVTPWASWFRATKTGSESMHLCYRIAKAATGRTTVLRLKGSYHGWHEWCSLEEGDVAPESSQWLLATATDIAAVVVEPPRFEPMSRDWLGGVRRACDRLGALLIFDSMIWGGRYALGGASEYYGVIPDLEAFGKAFGNGQAISFVVGHEATRVHGEIASGTYSGDITGLSALVDTLNVYATEPVIDTLWARGRQLQDGLRALIPESLATCLGGPVCQRVTFTNPAHGQQFSDAMLERGVIWHPLVAMPMYAHTVSQIDQVLDAAQASLAVLQ